MYSGMTISLFLAFYSISNLESYSYAHDTVKVVTYGEPCVASRQFPITIQGPKPSIEDRRIPVSLDLKIISDLFVQPPRRVEYPISIEAPCTTRDASSLLERVNVVDPLRGKSYVYNAHAPSASVDLLPLAKNYNFAIDVPLTIKKTAIEPSDAKCVPRLTGLASRVDRILVPACEASSSSSLSYWQ